MAAKGFAVGVAGTFMVVAIWVYLHQAGARV
jgi:hypothetical protein